MEDRSEQEKKYNHQPPPLTQEAARELFVRLGLEGDATSTRLEPSNVLEQAMQSNEAEKQRVRKDSELHEAKNGLMKETLTDLAVANKDFFVMLHELLKERYSEGILSNFDIDRFATGFAIVLKSYDIQFDSDLLPEFSQLGAEDVEKARMVLKNVLIGKNRDVFEEILHEPTIPPENVFLHQIVSKVMGKSYINKEDVLGAAVGYQMISLFWDKLNPQKPNSTPLAT